MDIRKMNDDQFFDALQFISKTHRTLHNTRRDFEWKIFITTLTFYVLTVAAKLAGDLKFPVTNNAKTTVWILAIIVAVLSCIYLWLMHRANDVNKSIAELAENNLMECSGVTGFIKNQSNVTKTKKRILGINWSFCWQFIIIFSFAIVGSIILTYG